MANFSANFAMTLTYTGPDGESTTAVMPPIVCAYQAQVVGTLSVPDATVGSTSYDIPFGDIATGATFALIENKTGQPLTVKINGAAASSHELADAGVTVIAMAALPAAGKVTAISVATTTTQSGDGIIAFKVFGDPT